MEYSVHKIADIRAEKAICFVVVLFYSESATSTTVKDAMKNGFGPIDSFVWRAVMQTVHVDLTCKPKCRHVL